MGKKLKFILAIALQLLLSAAVSAQEDYEKIYTAAYSPTFACTSGEAAYSVASHRSNSQSLIDSGACYQLSKDTRFKAKKIHRERGLNYVEIDLLGLPQSDQPLYVAGGLVFTSLACSGSSAGPGGQINRLERSRDGQLAIKRYMITSKCVNGEMRSFTKALD